MPLKDFREMRPQNEDAKEFYYQEYFENGSFRKEFLNVKTDDTQKNYDLIHTWYKNKFAQVEKEIGGAKTSQEEQLCQNKMIAYYKIFREATVDIFFEDRAKNPKAVRKIGFSAPKEFYPIQTKTKDFFRIFETGIQSLSDQVSPEDAVKQERERKANRIHQERETYQTDIEGKYQELEKKYNQAFSSDVNIGYFEWNSAYAKSTEIYEQSKNASILEMVENVSKTEIDGCSKEIEQLEADTVRDRRQEMEDMMFNVSENIDQKKYDKGMKDYDKALKDVSAKTKEQAEKMVKAKMSLYVATKKRMEERGFFSKLFHPFRTKKENVAFDKMRNDLKNTLGVNEEYMSQVDEHINQNDATFSQVPKINAKQEFFKTNYSQMPNLQAEHFEQSKLAKELGKEFTPKQEKTVTEKPVEAQKQVQITAPKVE